MTILRWVASLGLIFLGLGLFAGLIWISNPKLVWEELKAVGVLGFLAVVGDMVLSFLAWTWSWFILLRGAGIKVRWREVLSPMLAGSAVTYLTPSAYLGGEPVRAYWVAKGAGVSMAHVMAPTMVERLLGGISLLFFAAIGGFFALLSPTASSATKGAIALGLVIMTVFLLLGMISFAQNLQWISKVFKALGRLFRWQGVLDRLAKSASVMEEQIYQVLSHRLGHVLGSFILQLVTVFLTYIRPQIFFYFTKQALFDFPQLSLFFTLNVFISAFIWLTPGGLGLADGGRAGVFRLLGLSLSSAFAYNVLFRFVELLQVGLGVYILLRRGLLSWRFGRIRVEVEERKEKK
ncbi:MAG: lysylphosphatidylglycerol synthase transmembrane domain-containing protein [Candidatus Bipolaricaulaceae bacterium]